MIETLLQAAACAALVAALLWTRRRVTGHAPRPLFWAACLSAAVAVTVGTVARVSGVLLAVPVIAFAGYAVARGGWRLGDAGLFAIVLGIATAGSYVVVAALNPDTGSANDQGAVALVLLGAVLGVVAIVWSLMRRRRSRPESK